MPEGSRKDHPRSYRFTSESLDALDAIIHRTGESRSRVLERLIMEEANRITRQDTEARFDALEARLARLEEKDQ